MRVHIPRELRAFAEVFFEAGFCCYFVGGAVRDSLLGRRVADWDAATDARPEQVQKLFRKVIPTGIQHGTVSVRWRDALIETTTFRIDGQYTDGRRPQSVEFSTDLDADLSRRDFTINGMAVDPRNGRVIDPFGGLADLRAGLIKAIGRAEERFDEDGLRPLRAIRFAARFDFQIEAATLAAIRPAMDRFRQVSTERVRDEFAKIVLGAYPAYGLRLLAETGLLAVFLPELDACRGVEQGDYHAYDVFDHCCQACAASDPALEARLAALFHDIAKPACRSLGPDGAVRFYGHDQLSAEMTEAILRRMKFPNQLIDRVSHLVRHHMFDYSDQWTDAAVRRFVSRVGLDRLQDLVRLRQADAAGMRSQAVDPRPLVALLDRVARLRQNDAAFSIRDLAINGNHLAALGWPRGPLMGTVLAELLETVLDDPELNTEERLAEIAEGLKEKYGLTRP